MHARGIFWLIFLSPVLATAAEPDGHGGNDAELRDSARESLREKLAEAETLQSEIERLRQLSGEPSPNVQVRVRIVEVSLTKAKNVGWAWASTLDSNVVKLDQQLALLVQKSVARLRADENVLVADGFEARFHVGSELIPGVPAQGETEQGKLNFRGAEIAVTPRSQPDGRLAIDLVCKKFNPLIYSDQPPQQRVHEISTAVELAIWMPVFERLFALEMVLAVVTVPGEQLLD
jgi:hypothetical protein